MSIVTSLTFCLTLCLSFLALPSTSHSCFYPDGTLRFGDAPCLPDQAESFCCGQGHSCMSNGLCRWPDDEMTAPLAYVRGSCTDQSWQSDACPQHCDNVSPNDWSVIVTCPNNEYCCSADDETDQSCCNAKPNLFELAVATTVTVIGSPTSAITGSGTSVSHTSTKNTSIDTGTATATSTSKDTTNSGLGTGIGVGVGVGVFTVLLVLSGVWFFWWRRKNTRISQEQEQECKTEFAAGVRQDRTDYAAELPSKETYDEEKKGWRVNYAEVSGRQELEARGRQEMPE